MLQSLTMRAIQKFLPYFIMLFIATIFITRGIFLDRNDILAQINSSKVDQNTHFEKMYNDTNIKMSDGSQLAFKDVKEPVVILNFWASWCLPCLAEFPSINQLIEKYPNKIKVIGINNDEEKQDVIIKKIEKKYELKFSSHADVDGVLTAKYKIAKIPYSIVFINKKVNLVTLGEYDFNSDELKLLIENALKN
jgi:thiol-disulfide isomerase/thioredoxin